MTSQNLLIPKGHIFTHCDIVSSDGAFHPAIPVYPVSPGSPTGTNRMLMIAGSDAFSPGPKIALIIFVFNYGFCVLRYC